jgi:hypothetical protein
VPDSIRDRWDGPHWRRWALASGLILTAVGTAVAAGLATLFDQDAPALIQLVLLIELVTLSVIGSGMFDGLASRAIAGGLARQPAEDNRAARPAPTDADRARRDRRTIRSGLAALPIFVTFSALLFG